MSRKYCLKITAKEKCIFKFLNGVLSYFYIVRKQRWIKAIRQQSFDARVVVIKHKKGKREREDLRILLYIIQRNKTILTTFRNRYFIKHPTCFLQVLGPLSATYTSLIFVQ